LLGGILLAQPFDAGSLRTTGSAQSVAESVSAGTSFSLSHSGLLLYQTASQAQLTWVDPDGKKISTGGDPGYLSSPYLSPDGRYAMVTVLPLPVHSLLATATIFIPRGLPTAGKWLSLPRAAAAKKTSTLNPWERQQRAAGAGR
jgi:hypothetical protein